MACGCKNKNKVQTQNVTNINTTISLQNVQPTTQLTEAQQKQVDQIVDKINKISNQ